MYVERVRWLVALNSTDDVRESPVDCLFDRIMVGDTVARTSDLRTHMMMMISK